MGAEVLLLFPVSALISSAALFAPCEQCGLADFAKGALQPWSLVRGSCYFGNHFGLVLKASQKAQARRRQPNVRSLFGVP